MQGLDTRKANAPRDKGHWMIGYYQLLAATPSDPTVYPKLAWAVDLSPHSPQSSNQHPQPPECTSMHLNVYFQPSEQPPIRPPWTPEVDPAERTLSGVTLYATGRPTEIAD
ncbi:unnamed protein product [Penicillium bialowiezense]